MDAAEIERRLSALLASRGEILEGYLFGSFARGDAAAHSDVDVAVFVDEGQLPPSPFGYHAAMSSDLMKGLATSKVDVVVLNDAPPLLYHRVLRDGCRLFSRDLQATTGREGQALSRYFDFLPHLQKFDRALADRIRDGDFGR